jgi:hypothetical protein
MKSLHVRGWITVAILAALTAAGCASQHHFSRFAFEDSKLLPQMTPYDTNDVARSDYRLAYTFGYQDFLRAQGDRDLWIFNESQGAGRDGYLAGVAAAFEARAEYWRTTAAKNK